VNRYRVTFLPTDAKPWADGSPRRVFFVAAEDEDEAFSIAAAIESVLERVSRKRTLEQAIVDAVTNDE
jgi:hypothetical protein